MSIGQAYGNVLSAHEQKALQMACDLLNASRVIAE